MKKTLPAKNQTKPSHPSHPKLKSGPDGILLYIEEAGAKGLLPLSPAPQIPAEPASASLRTIALDDSEHFLHNHHASVATLRLLFTFAPECRSPSLRNQCSPSPEYPSLALSPSCLALAADFGARMTRLSVCYPKQLLPVLERVRVRRWHATLNE